VHFAAWSEFLFSLAKPSSSARHTERAIISSSSVRMTRTQTRPASAEITPALAAFLSTAASRLALRLGTGGRGQKLLPTVVAAKVERLSIAFGVESGGFVHGHSADGVFGHGFRFFHGHAPFLVVIVLSFDSVFHPDMPINSQLFRVNRKFLFPFLNSLVIFWLQV
jgi:hypothetical protein